jgi:hypothetical protein
LPTRLLTIPAFPEIKGDEMATRKLQQRARLPEIASAEDYEKQWWAAVYFGPNGKRLTRREFHAEHFDDENHLRRFYETNRAAFAAMAKPGERHFLWWRYDSPEPRVENWPEVAQLHSMRLLTADEITRLRAAAVAEDSELHARPMHAFLPFRRSVGFWMFCATEQRNPDIFESSQLAKMGALTSAEKEAIAEPARAIGRRRPLIFPARTLFFYIGKAERVLLGIDAGHDDETERILNTPPALCGQ